MRGVGIALILMLLHSFFSCEAAPFQIPDGKHPAFTHQNHFEVVDQHANDSSTPASEAEVHAHLSCLSGYNIYWPVTEKVMEQVVPCPQYYLPLRYPPPVPPPNSFSC